MAIAESGSLDEEMDRLPGCQAEKLFPYSDPPLDSKKFYIFCIRVAAADGPVPLPWRFGIITAAALAETF